MTENTAAVRAAERLRSDATGAHLVYDPHPQLDELRARADVHRGSLNALLGLTPLETEPAVFTVLGYELAEQVYRDHTTFSSNVSPAIAAMWGANILMMDEPEHRKYRALAQPAFAFKAMESWESRWLRPILRELLDQLPERGRFDAYHEYCALFPVRTIVSAFGIDPSAATQFHEWVLQISGGGTPEQARSAVRGIAEALAPVIEQRRREGDDSDVVGLLAASEVTDDAGAIHRLTDAEILGFANLMLTAGAGTTYRTLGFVLREVLSRPDLLASVRSDESLIGPVIEETLRWSPPVFSFNRRATADTTLADLEVPAGSMVCIAVGAANRDPRRWERPHEFDPYRPAQAHLAFGFGPHFCLGNQLARMELREALKEFLDRFPRITLDPAEPFPETSGLLYRVIDGLPVVVG